MDLHRIVKLVSCLALSVTAAACTVPGVMLVVSTYADVAAPHGAPLSPEGHIDALRNFTLGGGAILIGLIQLILALKYWPYRLSRRPHPPRPIGF